MLLSGTEHNLGPELNLKYLSLELKVKALIRRDLGETNHAITWPRTFFRLLQSALRTSQRILSKRFDSRQLIAGSNS